MGSAELCLTWDDHHNSLIRIFEELLQSNTLVDCTIAAEGQYLKAHKVVLSSCSPYFQMLFTQENEKNPIVVLKDMKFKELRAIIDFVYRGQVKLQDNELEQFLEAADSLQIRGLANHQKKTTPENPVSNPVSDQCPPSPPVPRKRRRTNPSQAREDAIVSPRGDVCEDNPENGGGVTSDVPVDVHVPPSAVPSSSSAGPSSSSAGPATSALPHTSSVSRRRQRLRRPPLPSPPVEDLSDTETVIKVEPEFDPEPEPLAEVFLHETKNEEYVDDMHLGDTEEGNPDDPSADVPTQQSTSQYTASPIFESTDDHFLTAPMPEQSGAQGAERDLYWPLPSWLTSQLDDSGACSSDDNLSSGTAASKKEKKPSLQKRPRRMKNQQECSICHKTFSGDVNMRKHKMNCVKPRLKCEFCGYNAVCMSALEMHLRKHTGVKPFKCEVKECGRAFAQMGNLVSHKRIHTAEMPYRCLVCSYACRHSISLKKHLKKNTTHRIIEQQLSDK